jgi:hypothetical protein
VLDAVSRKLVHLSGIMLLSCHFDRFGTLEE